MSQKTTSKDSNLIVFEEDVDVSKLTEEEKAGLLRDDIQLSEANGEPIVDENGKPYPPLTRYTRLVENDPSRVDIGDPDQKEIVKKGKNGKTQKIVYFNTPIGVKKAGAEEDDESSLAPFMFLTPKCVAFTGITESTAFESGDLNGYQVGISFGEGNPTPQQAHAVQYIDEVSANLRKKLLAIRSKVKLGTLSPESLELKTSVFYRKELNSTNPVIYAKLYTSGGSYGENSEDTPDNADDSEKKVDTKKSSEIKITTKFYRYGVCNEKGENFTYTHDELKNMAIEGYFLVRVSRTYCGNDKMRIKLAIWEVHVTNLTPLGLRQMFKAPAIVYTSQMAAMRKRLTSAPAPSVVDELLVKKKAPVLNLDEPVAGKKSVLAIEPKKTSASDEAPASPKKKPVASKKKPVLNLDEDTADM